MSLLWDLALALQITTKARRSLISPQSLQTKEECNKFNHNHRLSIFLNINFWSFIFFVSYPIMLPSGTSDSAFTHRGPKARLYLNWTCLSWAPESHKMFCFSFLFIVFFFFFYPPKNNNSTFILPWNLVLAIFGPKTRFETKIVSMKPHWNQ